jgi:hypothetical protein
MTSRGKVDRRGVSDAKAEWTLLLYMAGLKSAGGQDGFARAEARLVTALAGVPGGPDLRVLYEMSTEQGMRRGRIRGDGSGLELLEKKDGPTDPAAPESLTSFVDWAARRYPSERTALVLKGHGGGLDRPVGGIASDHYLAVSGLRSALEQTGRKQVDFCGLDACDMGLLEVAYELRNVASHFVATQSVEPTMAWPYKKSIEVLREGNVEPGAFAKIVARENKSAFLAATDLERIESLASSVDQIGDGLRQLLRKDRARVAALRDRLTSFGVENHYVDLKQLLDALGGVMKADALLEDAHETLAGDCFAPWPMFLSGGVDAGGLSIFFPRATGSTYLASYGQMQIARKNRWAGFVKEFCSPARAS